MIVVLVLFASCIRPEDVRILGVEQVGIRSLARTDLAVRVDNRSNRKLALREGRMQIVVNEKPLAEIMLREPVEIARRTESTVQIPLQVKLNNPLLLLSGLVRGLPSDPSQIMLTGEVVVKGGCMKKKLKFDKMTLSDFMRTFGGDQKQLINFLEQWQDGLF